MTIVVKSEQGSVLIIAVIAMLIMGVLSVSFALLANIETTIGFNYKEQAQAEALAEAGLERGRDALRTGATESCGFTRWTSASAVGLCGSPLGKLLFNSVSLGAGQYSAVIDNDCIPLVPAAIQEGGCTGATPSTDSNETAVVTAWALAGTGRARVRAIVGIDSPWKHVCSNSSQDNPPGYCNEQLNRNGSPVLQPADPNDPNGPAAYDTLPTPTLGCSAIDPTVHGNNAACTGVRKVVTGDRSLRNCDGGNQQYQGYFDCALTTPCEAAICGTLRSACVRTGDTRIGVAGYVEAVGGVCPTAGGVRQTGMVFTGDQPQPSVNMNIGTSATDGRNVYVLRSGSTGKVTIQSATLYGTLVVEGNGQSGCTNPTADMELKNFGTLTTASTDSTHPVLGNSGGARTVYGYPLALLLYDPQLPVPTANPFSPQDTCADMGSSNTLVNGMIYSGGHVQFNPISLNGTIVGFEIQVQGGANASLGYNYTYGKDAPPPGFPLGGGSQVVIIRKSFMVCTTYAADSGGGTTCN